MLKFHNSLSNKLEEFIPLEENRVKMYVCGPTVYDKAHLGHARCYITWDVLYRYLKFLGYNATYCRNITDVDDKILKKADIQGVEPDVITKEFYESFENSMKGLNCLKPDVEPRATKTIGEMIAMVKKLIEKGFAYEADGDVYFSVEKYKKYGQLSKQPLDDLMAGARVEAGEKKKSPLDFALWKKDEKHGYKSPWGLGRPGWHIECSAMSKKFLGDSIDIHAGGADLTFPHHENELAQSECANGCEFVKYWLHNGFVTINKEKMSKSLNNFLTIDDLLKKYDSNAIRFFILTNHYRMPVEFNDEALNSAAAGAKRLINAASGYEKTSDIDNEAKDAFIEAMNDDLNTSKALAVLFSLSDKIKKSANKDDAQKYACTLITLGEVLGFDFSRARKEVSDEELRVMLEPLYKTFEIESSLEPRAALDKIISIRKAARDNKDWAKSDIIRDELDGAGIMLKDSKEGTTWQVK
ncbi:TPA: cysteine--tRNA ligase [Candidatus Galligastranaerophilus faecipullorum]|nr:cysteine--tRNA ligase [Candidatus Galligastranaerophilus faecipullorum]